MKIASFLRTWHTYCSTMPRLRWMLFESGMRLGHNAATRVHFSAPNTTKHCAAHALGNTAPHIIFRIGILWISVSAPCNALYISRMTFFTASTYRLALGPPPTMAGQMSIPQQIMTE